MSPPLRPRLLPAFLTVSAAALIGVAVHEGYRETAYRDPVGIPTVGFGATVHADGATPVQMGDRLPPVRALITLGAHVGRTEQVLRQCIGPVPLAQHEWDAYVSLAYNVGATRICSSTIVRLLHQTPPDYAGACRQIGRLVYAGGRRLPGLEARRAAEMRLCLGEEAAP